MRDLRDMALVALSSASILVAGIVIGRTTYEPPLDSELATAQVLSGDRQIRLIGYQCGDRNLTALARWEDEFPEQGCKEIRILRDDEAFPVPPGGERYGEKMAWSQLKDVDRRIQEGK